VKLVPKALEILHILLEQRGRIVEKAELMRRVWPDTTVEEIGLARNISSLRKALGDETSVAQMIETIPRRGYRFVAEVQTRGEAQANVERRPLLPAEDFPGVAPESPASQGREGRKSRRVLILAASAAALALLIYWQFYRPSPYLESGAGYASLAVLPFECLSPDLTQSAFCRGFSELLAARVSRLERVHVTSPSTIQRYRDGRVPAAISTRILGLDVVLEGTAQSQNGRLRITARLSDVHSGKMIWADSYDYSAADPAQAQADAAARIQTAVGAHLMLREGLR
jgi:DNA-binding winged helix-turn-helix (wHTH) protein/TolB-like protein